MFVRLCERVCVCAHVIKSIHRCSDHENQRHFTVTIVQRHYSKDQLIHIAFGCPETYKVQMYDVSVYKTLLLRKHICLRCNLSYMVRQLDTRGKHYILQQHEMLKITFLTAAVIFAQTDFIKMLN